AFLKAMHDVRLGGGPIGPIRLDEYGTPVLDIYIRKVERRDGKLVNAILKTYPQVSQFWTYDPTTFVTQPVFSREFPPSKYLEYRTAARSRRQHVPVPDPRRLGRC